MSVMHENGVAFSPETGEVDRDEQEYTPTLLESLKSEMGFQESDAMVGLSLLALDGDDKLFTTLVDEYARLCSDQNITHVNDHSIDHAVNLREFRGMHFALADIYHKRSTTESDDVMKRQRLQGSHYYLDIAIQDINRNNEIISEPLADLAETIRRSM